MFTISMLDDSLIHSTRDSEFEITNLSKFSEIVRSKMNLVRQQFIWSHKNQTKNDSKMFQVYKLTVAAYLISMSFYGWRDQKLNPKNIHG